MSNGRIVVGAILVVLGLSALLQINIWPILWPLFLIFIGLRIIGGRNEDRYEGRWDRVKEERNNDIDETLIFNGMNKKIVTDNFTGGKITTIFGGGELDLREAKIKEGETAVIELTAVFGGMKFIVPEDWDVRDSISGIAGGIENRTAIPKSPKGNLEIKGTAVFGGGEIDN